MSFVARMAVGALMLNASFLLAQGSPDKPPVPAVSRLERSFFAILRNGDGLQFLSYVSEDGVNLGRYAEHATKTEIEEQLTKKKDLYCKLFDTTCLHPAAGDHGPSCSYRELLNQSEKVRTASTETTRNNVRQAILVAEVQNDKCGGHVLIDFIFNQQSGGWKLFSIP
jgi:hypothetical protein